MLFLVWFLSSLLIKTTYITYNAKSRVLLNIARINFFPWIVSFLIVTWKKDRINADCSFFLKKKSSLTVFSFDLSFALLFRLEINSCLFFILLFFLQKRLTNTIYETSRWDGTSKTLSHLYVKISTQETYKKFLCQI